MVAREQDLGHGETAELPRPRVLGALDESVGSRERILSRALLVAEHAGQQSGDGIDHDHRGDLAA
jgi:hypothetical protein